MLNEYIVAFPFQGEYEYCEVNANQIANKALSSMFGDSVDILWENFYNSSEIGRFTRNGKVYQIDFSYNCANKFNIYEVTDEGEESIVERDIPYIVLIVNNNQKIIYNLSEYI